MDKRAIIEAAIFTPASKGRWGIPVLAWGEPGVAKTSIIEEIAESFDLPLVVLEPGAMGEGGFGVVPVPEQGVLRFPPPEWIEELEGGGLIFLDEISSCPPALTPALLGILFARRVGFRKFHPRVRIIAAANPPEVAASGFDLPPPLANRCAHIDWDAPTVDEHTAYMMRGETAQRRTMGKKYDAKEKEAHVLNAWPTAWARAVGLETAFLRRSPEKKNRMPKNVEASKAWPSDRTWEDATRAFATSQVHGLSEVDRFALVAGFLGNAVATEWFTFVHEADLPDPAALLDGQVSFKHRSARPDITVAVLNSCAALVVPPADPKDKTANETRTKRAGKLWDIVNDVIDAQEGDLAKDAVTRLVDAKLAKDGAIKTMAKMQRSVVAPSTQEF